jgi:hypothetical protein
MKKQLVALTTALSLFAATNASATSVGIDGMLNFTNYTSPAPFVATGGTTFGFGGFLRGSGPLTFELGLQYAPRSINVGTATINELEIPLLLRFHVLIVTFALGAYYGLQIGTSASGAGATAPTVSGNDFGLVGALGLQLPLAPGVSVFGEGRWIFGLTSLSISGSPSTIQWRNLEILAGLDLGF